MDALPVDPVLGLALTAVLVALNGLFVGGELAAVRSSAVRLERMADHSALARSALHLVGHIDQALAASQLGITLVSLLLGWLGEPALAALVGPALAGAGLGELAHPVAFAVAFVGITFGHVLFGELVPKSVAIIAPERTAMLVAGPFRLFASAVRPFIAVLTLSARAVLRPFGLSLASAHERAHTGAELRLLLGAAEASGEIDAVEQDLASRSLGLGDRTLKDVMVPRVAMGALDATLPLADARARALGTGAAILPVHRGAVDGTDAVIAWTDLFDPAAGDDWADRSRPALALPGSLRASVGLARMRDAGTELAVVLDEHGGTDGTVSVRSLLELLVAPAVAADELPGSLHLTVLEELLGVSLPGDAATLNGFLLEQLGRIAAPGDAVRVGDWRLEVLSVDPERHVVARVRCLRVPA